MVLRATWKLRSLTFDQYCSALGGFLVDLRHMHPMLGELFDAGRKPNDETRIDDDLVNLGPLARERAYDKKAKREYTHLDSNGYPTAMTVSPLGYGMTFVNGKKLGKGRVTVGVAAGQFSQWLNSAVSIATEDTFYPEYNDYRFWLKLLDIVVKHWAPENAIVFDHTFYQKTDQKGDDYNIGWINYFSDPAYRDVSDPRIVFSPFAEGAVVILSPTPVSADNADEVALGIHVRDVFREHGMMNYREPAGHTPG